MNIYRRRIGVKSSNFNFFAIFSLKGLKALTVLCLLLFLLAPAKLFSQSSPPANLEVFYKLADSSVTKVLTSLPESNSPVYLRLDLPEGYSVFRNRIIQDLIQSGKKVLLASDSLAPSLDISIDRAKVTYSDLFRQGLFGSYESERIVSLGGSFILSSGAMVKNTGDFSFTARDTVKYDDLRGLEDISIPFTRGEIPSEPLFSTLWEPVVALGTAAVAVYLFFTVRSK
ncbi:MAG: hypothetical protein HF314_06215 [Ignavibacteria bacterium]|nr:hypothetical protein [Ignavibacteria bacterium]MCU7502648.1 hypothetical protein [Ignavibacteria bacterium]MCU7515149.1 hypothetical protein [Ignavibacteria bacterium]